MSIPETAEHIGKRMLRREDEALLRGNGRFIDDLPEPQDVLHLGFVMSPHPHALIKSIDVSQALKLPGVIAVYTGEDLARWTKPIHTEIYFPGYLAADREALARTKVRFVGEQVAVVVAEDRYIVEDAVELVQVEYEVLPSVVDVEEAKQPGAPQVHDHIPNNIIFKGEFATPNFDREHTAGKHTLSERFRTGRVAGVPMEPRGCLAIPEQGDSIVFHTSTQIQHLVRDGLAHHLGKPETSIRVIVPDVGGGFGTKAQLYPEELVAAALCFKLRRPIKWLQDRREELLTNIHARDHIYDVQVWFTDDGVVTGLRLELHTNAGAYSTYPFGCTLETTGGARMIVGPYKIRNYTYRSFSVASHTCPAGVYRGVAQPSCMMAIEGLMDRIARKLGMDPADVRRRNVITPADMPWVSAIGVRYDTGSYLECIEKAIVASDYVKFRQGQPTNRLVNGKYRGIGICNMTEFTGMGAPAWRARGLARMSGIDSATLRMEPSGKISVYISHATAGQGHMTTFAQIAADYLGANIDDIRIFEGDTASSPYGTNTFASRSAVTGGGAVIRSAVKVAAKLRRIASKILEASPEDIVLRDGRAEVTGVAQMNMTFKQIAEVAYSLCDTPLPKDEEYGLEASEYYDPPVVTIANAVHIVEVAVDAEDGRVTIEKHVIVHDCGRVINPMIVDGQIHGGAAQGIGEALMEEMVYDKDGQMLNASLLDYLLPTTMDVPDFKLSHIETPTIDGLGGFKGVGEGGLIGAVPAVVNAVADALSGIGANVNKIPLRPAYLRSLMRSAALTGR